MLGSNKLEESMLGETLNLFRGTDKADISAAQGVMLIDGWLQALDGDPNIDRIKDQLNELRTVLQSAQPDEQHLRSLLTSLADTAQEVAEGPTAEGTWTGGLESLSKILRDLAADL
jgi:hypothetical protein